MIGTYKLAWLTLLALSLVGAPLGARATNLGMQMSDGPTTVTLCDQNINTMGCTHNGNDQSNMVGDILFNGTIGSWTLSGITGLGPPVTTLPELLDLSAVTASSMSGASPMSFLLTVTGLTAPLGNVSLATVTNGTSVLGTSDIAVETWLSPMNTAFCDNFACGTLISHASYTGTTWGSTVNGNGSTGGGPYALTLELDIDTHGLADTITFAPTVSAVPESGTVSLLATGLLAIGARLRTRRAG